MTDFTSTLDLAINKALEEIVTAENEAILGWCRVLECTPQELAERYNVVSRMGTKADALGIRITSDIHLEPKE